MRHYLVVDNEFDAGKVLRIRYRRNVLFPEDPSYENSFLRSVLYVTGHGGGNWPMAMRLNDKIEGRL